MMIDDREYELEIIKQEERSDSEFVVLVIALLAAAGGAAFMLAMVALLILLVVLNAPAAYLQSQPALPVAVVTATPTLPSPPTAESFAPIVVVTLTVTPPPADTLLPTESPTPPATDVPPAVDTPPVVETPPVFDTPAVSDTPIITDSFSVPATEAPFANATPYAPPAVAPPGSENGPDLTPLLTDVLGPSNRAVNRLTQATQTQDVVDIAWTINSATSNELLNDGARMDVIHMLVALRNAGAPFAAVNFTGTFPSLDATGNQVESPVVTLTYTHEALDTIDWANQAYVDNELKNTIFELATYAQLEPAFQGR